MMTKFRLHKFETMQNNHNPVQDDIKLQRLVQIDNDLSHIESVIIIKYDDSGQNWKWNVEKGWFGQPKELSRFKVNDQTWNWTTMTTESLIYSVPDINFQVFIPERAHTCISVPHETALTLN